MRIRIKDPLAIFADNAAGGVVIEDGVIAEILQTGDEPRTLRRNFRCIGMCCSSGADQYASSFLSDLPGLRPGTGQGTLRRLKTLYPVWAGLTPDYLYVATRLALAELLLSGCTTAADHHYVFPAGLENGVDIQVAAAADLCAGYLTRGSMNLQSRMEAATGLRGAGCRYDTRGQCALSIPFMIRPRAQRFRLRWRPVRRFP